MLGPLEVVWGGGSFVGQSPPPHPLCLPVECWVAHTQPPPEEACFLIAQKKKRLMGKAKAHVRTRFQCDLKADITVLDLNVLLQLVVFNGRILISTVGFWGLVGSLVEADQGPDRSGSIRIQSPEERAILTGYPIVDDTIDERRLKTHLRNPPS